MIPMIDVRGVAEEDDGLVVDAGDAEVVGGDSPEERYVFGACLVPVVVEPTSGQDR